MDSPCPLPMALVGRFSQDAQKRGKGLTSQANLEGGDPGLHGIVAADGPRSRWCTHWHRLHGLARRIQGLVLLARGGQPPNPSRPCVTHD